MRRPPKEIDGAQVLEWAWSGKKCFGSVCNESGVIVAEIYGLAICKYSGGGAVYRFSCNINWESEQDAEYCSIEEAKQRLPVQYQNVQAVWSKYE